MAVLDFYRELARVAERPAPFSVYTAEELWTDSHTSQRMLAFHLDPDVDVSSRRHGFIDESIEWMVAERGLSSRSRVIDFGCGPGLYASRFAARGVRVTGVDFSPASIAYAKEQAAAAGHEISYHQANYLEFVPDGEFDLVIMIMCDYCALSPPQRSQMLRTFADSLASDGRLIFDVYSMTAFGQKQEQLLFEENLLDGFWSPSPYFGFLATFTYDVEHVALDKYTIVEPTRRHEVYNWMQYFSPDCLERELAEHGLIVEKVLGDVAGRSFDPSSSEFAVVARRA